MNIITKKNITNNIQYLVSTEPSIAFASRHLGINRQQLNKYLKGTSIPSLRTLRRIALTFDVPTASLTGPLDILKQHLLSRNSGSEQSAGDRIAAHLSAASSSAQESLSNYCGRYFRYSIVPTSPLKVLRSYMVICQDKGLTYALKLDRITNNRAHWKRSEVRRSSCIITFFQDRIQFFGDGGFDGGSTAGLSIIYPAYMPGIQYLSGMQVSTFDYGTKPIYQTNVVLRRLTGFKHCREDLRACGLLGLDDPELNDEINYRLHRDNGVPGFSLASR